MKPKHLVPDSHIGDCHSKEFFVPLDTQSSEIFIDESGSKASRSNFFVLGMIKSRDTGLLARYIRGIREKHRFWDEFHFSTANLVALVSCESWTLSYSSQSGPWLCCATGA